MRYLYRFILILLVTLLCSYKSYSTHARAGEITYRQISLYSFEITVVYYTNSLSPANRDQVPVEFGDNTSAIAPLVQRTTLQNDTWYNLYTTTHTYPGPGTYLITFQDPNRIQGIQNMNNSVNTPFYVETQLQINPFMGPDHSPVLLNPPIDYAEAGQIYIYNPNAYDPDGDSLAFSLVTPEQGQGQNVDGFYEPVGIRSPFRIDPYKGIVTWDYPDTPNTIYNIAIMIEEFRKKVRIGYMIRDMQIIVKPGVNHPPVIKPINDTCVDAGSILNIKVYASDIDSNQYITLNATGGPFLQSVSPAAIYPNPAYGQTNVMLDFRWVTSCLHIRKQPYMVVFKAEDNDPNTPLDALATVNITVVGPAPVNLNITPKTQGFDLKWDPPPTCNNAKGYYIYRRVDSSYWDTSKCVTGVPAYTGFSLLDTTIGYNSTHYFDNNHNLGISPGVTYCYRVTAIYLNDSNYEVDEGYASSEVCAKLNRTLPEIAHVSVTNTGSSDGIIYMDWVRPTQLDTTVYQGPYKFNILRSDGNFGFNLTPRKTIKCNSISQLKDTILVDSFLNTSYQPYSYQIEFYSTDNGKDYLIGVTQIASSPYLTLLPSQHSLNLKWSVNVPWINDTFIAYRKNDINGKFDSIGYTKSGNYLDTGLVNGKNYCYYIKTVGAYSLHTHFLNSLANLSEISCNSPRDTVKPCPPNLMVNTNCNLRVNILYWSAIDTVLCDSNVVGFNIYFSRQITGEVQLLAQIKDIKTLNYNDNRSDLQYSIAGCYYITTIDKYNNESAFSNKVCIDTCQLYELPNIFTPNGDHINDSFKAVVSRFIEKVNMRIFNRWGELVFTTVDPLINWDGTDMGSHKECSPGTYYYICDIYEIDLEGTKPKTLKGTITLIR